MNKLSTLASGYFFISSAKLKSSSPNSDFISIVTIFPAPAKCIEHISPCLFIIDASVEPAPISKIASGVLLPGVVKAPLIAISASTPPTSTKTPNFSCNLSALTIAAIPTAFSIENSSAIPPFTF